jgi:adenylate cyclase
MTAANDSNDVPTAEEIRAAVERIVASPGFHRSPQLVAFLRFVVESALGGKAEYLKSYTIGVEALGRNEYFDPQVDPIVRVEAARLRRALASYFVGDSTRSSVMIEIPLGGYVPTFSRRQDPRSIEVLIAILIRTLRIMRIPSQAYPFRLLFPGSRRRQSG